MRTQADIQHEFSSIKVDDTGRQKIMKIEVAARDFALDIIDLVPESAHRTAALRKILEAKMTCVQAISHATPTQETPNAKPQKNK